MIFYFFGGPQLNVLIVEDNSPTRLFLRSIIKDLHYIEFITEAENDTQCLKIIENSSIDLVLLDVDLGTDITGLDIARIIKEQYPGIMIIFITAFPEYAASAFNVDAVHYVLKPFTKASVIAAVNKAKKILESRSASNSKLMVKQGASIFFIDPDEILFIEKIGKRCCLHTENNGVVEIYQTLSNLEKQLPSYFYRSHQSYIINTHKVKELRPLNAATYDVLFNGTKEAAMLLRKKYDDFCQKLG
jgi:two-component system LytT family response regulator